MSLGFLLDDPLGLNETPKKKEKPKAKKPAAPDSYSVLGAKIPVPKGPTAAQIAGQTSGMASAASAAAGIAPPVLKPAPKNVPLEKIPSTALAGGYPSAPVHEQLRRTKGTLEEAMARADAENGWAVGSPERASYKAQLQRYMAGGMGATANLANATRGKMSLYDAFAKDAPQFTKAQEEKDVLQGLSRSFNEAGARAADIGGPSIIPSGVKRGVGKVAAGAVNPIGQAEMAAQAAADPMAVPDAMVIQPAKTLFDSNATAEQKTEAALGLGLLVAPGILHGAGVLRGRLPAKAPPIPTDLPTVRGGARFAPVEGPKFDLSDPMGLRESVGVGRGPMPTVQDVGVGPPFSAASRPPTVRPTRDAGSLKSPSDSINGNAKRVGDFTSGETASKKGASSLADSGDPLVVASVIRQLHNDKVFRSVIKRVPVDVMDNLFGKESSAQIRLGDKSVLLDKLAVDPNLPVPHSVSRFVDEFNSLIPSGVKRVPAGTGTIDRPSRRGTVEGGAAVRANVHEQSVPRTPQNEQRPTQAGPKAGNAKEPVAKGLEDASPERRAAYQRMQAARRAQSRSRRGGTKSGAAAKILPEEIDYAREWIKEKSAKGAEAIADEFVAHMKSLGLRSSKWRSVFEQASEPGRAPKNESTAAMRRKADLPEFESAGKETFAQWHQQAKDAGYDTPKGAGTLAEKVLSGEKKTLSESESVGIASRLDQLDREFDAASEAVDKAIGTDKEQVAADHLESLRQEIDNLTKVTNEAGTQQARDFVARKAFVYKDMTFSSLYARHRAAAGRALTETETTALRDLAKENERLKKEIEDYKAQGDAKAAEATVAKMRTSIPKSGPATERIAAIRQARSEAVTRFKEKWKAAAPKPGLMSDPFGAKIAAERLSQLAQVAPEILEIAKTVVEEGVVKVADVVKAVSKELGGEVTENEVAALLAGEHRPFADKVKRDVSEWQRLRAQARDVFARERERIAEEIRTEKARNTAESKAKIKAWQEQESARKAAEKAYLDDQAAFEKDQAAYKRKLDSADRRRYVQWWKDSVGGQRAKLLNDIDRVQERMAQYDKGVLKSAQKEQIDPTLRDLEIKREALRIEADRKRAILQLEKEKAQRGKPAAALSGVLDALGGFRSIKASLDLSAPLNQGFFALMTNTKAWKDAWSPTLQVIRKEGFDKYAASVRADEALYNKMVLGKVDLPALTQHPGEEMFVSALAEKIPGVGLSEREYGAFLTELRRNMFRELTEAVERGGHPLDTEGYRVIGDYVNTVTGRGMFFKGGDSLGRSLAHVFFAPRYWSSLFETAVGRPAWGALNYGSKTGNYAPFKVLAKKYARAATAAGGMLYVAHRVLSPQGWEIVTDPRDVDFGRARRKGKSGETQTMDLLPENIKQPIRFVAQMTLGRKSADGKIEGGFRGRATAIGSTLEGKAAPIPSLAIAVADGKKFGESYDLRTLEGAWNATKSLAEPMSIGQFFEVLSSKDLSPWEKAVAIALSPLGKTVNIREPGKAKPAAAKPGLPRSGDISTKIRRSIQSRTRPKIMR